MKSQKPNKNDESISLGVLEELQSKQLNFETKI
jgi:hypothetical protein